MLSSAAVAPGGGVGLKQTLPYWYSLSVALNSLGAVMVLLASTCMAILSLAVKLRSKGRCPRCLCKQTLRKGYVSSMTLNFLGAVMILLASTCTIY